MHGMDAVRINGNGSGTFVAVEKLVKLIRTEYPWGTAQTLGGLLTLLLMAALAASCSRAVGAGNDAGANAGRPDAAWLPDGGQPPDAAIDAGTDPPTDCEDLRWWLAGEINGGLSTVVIRFDAIDFEPLGWQVFSVPAGYERISEGEAREAAEQVASWPIGMLMNPEDTDAVYIFLQDHATGGDTVVVSARSPLAVFAATMRYNVSGSITHPAAWRDPAGLGLGCVDQIAPYPAPSLSAYSTWFYPPSTIPPENIAALETALAHTLIIRAWSGAYFFVAAAVRWVACLAPVRPETNEWIVILSGGWLE